MQWILNANTQLQILALEWKHECKKKYGFICKVMEETIGLYLFFCYWKYMVTYLKFIYIIEGLRATVG